MHDIDEDVRELARTIWDTMFSSEFRLTDGGEPREPREPGEHGEGAVVTSMVGISGAWRGAVIVAFPVALAASLTSALFGGDEVPGNDEIRDALGELGNILAGNIKALVPEPSDLSLPSVTFGTDYAVKIPGAILQTQVCFLCAGEVMTISVMEGDDTSKLLG